MTNKTTPARWSKRLYQIQKQFDEVLINKTFGDKLPALHNYDYDFYLKSVLDLNSMHIGKIMYEGREVRRIGK